jgi:hypothetical protein
MVTAETI